MPGSYSSIWKGSQIDSAVGVILNSGVTSGQLGVLKNVTPGLADPSKVLVLDSSRNITGVNEFGVTILKSSILKLEERSSDPTENPPAGYQYLYLKSGGLFLKNSSGTVSKFGGGTEQEFIFTGDTSVTCNHNLGKQFPIIDVYGSDGKPIECQVWCQNTNTALISFSHAQTGKVIIRTV
jgi:hypothetical protein